MAAQFQGYEGGAGFDADALLQVEEEEQDQGASSNAIDDLMWSFLKRKPAPTYYWGPAHRHTGIVPLHVFVLAAS